MVDPHGGVGGDPLGHARCGVDRLARVAQPSRAPGEQPCCLHPRRHLGQHGLDHLLVGDRPAELLSLGGVADGVLQGGSRQADAAGGDADPAGAEGGERDLQSLPLLAEPVGGRHAGVLEDELGAHGVADPHLPLVAADAEAGRIALDDEGGDPVAALRAVDGGEDDRTSASAPLVIQILVPSRR